MFDVIVRGGTVIDGTGAKARTADIAIKDGWVVEVGKVSGTAAARDRRRRPARHAGLRGHAQPLRRAGDLGSADDALQLARCHHGRHGQLRRRFCARTPRQTPLAHRAHGRRRGHPRHRHARGNPVGMGVLPRIPGRDRAQTPRDRLRHTSPARPPARLRDGRARRGERGWWARSRLSTSVWWRWRGPSACPSARRWGSSPWAARSVGSATPSSSMRTTVSSAPGPATSASRPRGALWRNHEDHPRARRPDPHPPLSAARARRASAVPLGGRPAGGEPPDPGRSGGSRGPRSGLRRARAGRLRGHRPGRGHPGPHPRAPPQPDSVLLVEGGRIAAAGPAAEVEVPAGAEVLDLAGRWIIPGLIDGHVHFFQSGGLYTRPDVVDLRDRVPYESELAAIRERLPDTFARYLRSGITAVADVGGPMWNFEVRRLAEEAEKAPRVAVAGPLVSTYQPEALTTDDPPILKVESEEEALALVRRLAEKKADFVKIWYIVSRGETAEANYPLIAATIEESHRLGVRVAVHATELETARLAVRAGADVLVHSVADAPVDEDFVRLLAESGGGVHHQPGRPGRLPGGAVAAGRSDADRDGDRAARGDLDAPRPLGYDGRGAPRPGAPDGRGGQPGAQARDRHGQPQDAAGGGHPDRRRDGRRQHRHAARTVDLPRARADGGGGPEPLRDPRRGDPRRRPAARPRGRARLPRGGQAGGPGGALGRSASRIWPTPRGSSW